MLRSSKWYILTLGTLTHVIVVGMGRMALPVLLPSIGEDLHLNLFELGIAWGAMNLGGIFGLLGGAICDKYGTQKTLVIACLAAALSGALRAVSKGFYTFAASMFLFGLFCIPLPLAVHKAAGEWFPQRQLGFANGILAMGIGMGATFGPGLGNILSAMLGGWRVFLVAHAFASCLLAMMWLLSITPSLVSLTERETNPGTISKAVFEAFHNTTIVLLAISNFFISAVRMGYSGYIPLYLRKLGWDPISADRTLALVGLASIVGVLPLSHISDRLQKHADSVLVYVTVLAVGVFLLGVCKGIAVWIICASIGLVQEALAVSLITLVMSSKRVQTGKTGIGLGLSMTFSALGGFLGPALGGKVAHLQPAYAFYLWSSFCIIAVVVLLVAKKHGY